MRIPLAANLESRDGGLVRDGKTANGLVESRGQDAPPALIKRPGVVDQGLIHSGTAQFLYNWNGLKAIIWDTIYSGTVSTIVSGPSSTNLDLVGLSETLNPSDKDSAVTLSNSNLTAQSTTSYRAVRATQGKSSGKWYWEVTFSTNDCLAGVGTSSASLAGLVGNDANSWGVYFQNGNKYHSNSPTAFVSGVAAGSTVGIGLDMSAGTAALYVSGTSAGSFASGLSGTIYPMVSPNSSGSMTVNFGAQDFTYTIPSGYSAIGPSSYVSGLQFSAVETNSTASTPRLFFKTSRQAFVINRSGAVSAVTYASSMGAGTYMLTTLTRSGTTATATLTDDVFNVGDSVTIAGASPSGYNGSAIVTAVTSGSAAQVLPITITRNGVNAACALVSGQPHGLTDGATYTISGATQSAYNGSFAITKTSDYTFAYTVTVTAETPSSPATGSPIIAMWRDGTTNIISAPSGSTTYTASTFGPHTFTVGDTITFDSPGIAGTYTVATVPSSQSYTFTGPAGPFFANGLRPTRTPVPAISSIIRAAGSATATITTSVAHRIMNGDSITVSGANQAGYNISSNVGAVTSTTLTYTTQFVAEQPTSPATGTPVVTVPAVNPTFSYTVSGSPTTPATGTITAQGGGGTVPGVPYIDGYLSVMDANGVIWSSDQDDPTTWPALSFLTARNENGRGVALAKSMNYLVAFKEYSTEYYYDAKNSSGSPFSPVDNGFTRIGCASGESVSSIGNTICWISQLKQGNRSVHRIDGLQAQEIATADVCRILGNDSLSNVYAYGLDLKGHPLYMLVLPDSGVSLAYDLSSSTWTQWTSLTLNNSGVSVTSISLSGTTATVVATAHGINDGDPVKISGADQSPYNGIFQVRKVDADTFTFETSAGSVTPATGTITATGYTESYFKFVKAATVGGVIYLLHETDGHLYQMSSSTYQDAGNPINVFTRSVRLDAGSDDPKKMPKVRFIGDLVSSSAMIRFSDDDCQSFSKYRVINLSLDPAEVNKCGSFRRRNIEFRHVANTPLHAEALELEISK